MKKQALSISLAAVSVAVLGTLAYSMGGWQSQPVQASSNIDVQLVVSNGSDPVDPPEPTPDPDPTGPGGSSPDTGSLQVGSLTVGANDIAIAAGVVTIIVLIILLAKDKNDSKRKKPTNKARANYSSHSRR